ncbi:MAG: hypothetical protein DSY33_01260 [Archaeoglobus sp.]|nr:MAG: hypothetical protein DSY33_01260 [Archaeoglobus sp.]
MKSKKSKKSKKSNLDTNFGVSPVVGMILILAIIAGIMAIIQTEYVPKWDYQKEAQNFNVLTSEASRIPEILTSGVTSTSLHIDVGVNYPQYPFLVNPLSSYGVIEVIPENVSISYKVYDNTVKENYTSSAIVIRPVYLYMPEINITYEYGAVIEYGKNYAKPIMLNQIAFSRNEITLPIVNSTKVLTAVKTINLHFFLLSRGVGKKVYNLTISFKTLYPKLWKSKLEKIYNDSLAKISVSGNVVTVRFKSAMIVSIPAWCMYTKPVSSRTSTMQVSAVVTQPSQVYLNPQGRSSITIQVLDKYGNPASNASVRVWVANTSVCKLLVNNALVDSLNTTTGIDGLSVVYIEGLKQGNTKIFLQSDIPATKGGYNLSVVLINVTKKAGVGRYTIDIIHANGSLVGYYGYGRCCRCWNYYNVYSYDILASVSPKPDKFTPVNVYFLNNSEGVLIQTTEFCNSSGYVHVSITAGVYTTYPLDDSKVVPPQYLVDEKPTEVVVSVGASSTSKQINYT